MEDLCNITTGERILAIQSFLNSLLPERHLSVIICEYASKCTFHELWHKLYSDVTPVSFNVKRQKDDASWGLLPRSQRIKTSGRLFQTKYSQWCFLPDYPEAFNDLMHGLHVQLMELVCRGDLFKYKPHWIVGVPTRLRSICKPHDSVSVEIWIQRVVFGRDGYGFKVYPMIVDIIKQDATNDCCTSSLANLYMAELS